MRKIENRPRERERVHPEREREREKKRGGCWGELILHDMSEEIEFIKKI